MDVLQLPSITEAMIRSIRNNGNCGIAMMAVSAVDIALWDLKAKLFDIPLVSLLGKSRNEMLLYGSGGFTTYTDSQLEEQLGTWVDMGIKHVKIKIGRSITRDVERVQLARRTIGLDTGLYVDANGAYNTREAVSVAYKLEASNITWFEEPVTSDNQDGLHFIRSQVPPGTAIAAGEYGYNLSYFQKMLSSCSVDVLQADATRCGGISGFLDADKLCHSYRLPYSSHCAPALHLHACLASSAFFIAEYFYDHTRIEGMLLDSSFVIKDGCLKPDMTRPGLGFDFKYSDAETYKIIG